VSNTDTETASIQLEQFIPHPPSKVWRALTTPSLMGKWWAEGDIRPEVGHRFTLDMGTWGMQPCEVLEVVPESLVRYSFTESWILTWRLEPEGKGTRLFFEHDGFDLSKPADQQAFTAMGGGWAQILPNLAKVAGEA
jgi:uncharacterized protein YndB with AHSA1/START domain